MISNSYSVMAESVDDNGNVSIIDDLYSGTYDQAVSFVESFSNQIGWKTLDLMICDNLTNMIISRRTIIRESAT